jgi:hypothetical protein
MGGFDMNGNEMAITVLGLAFGYFATAAFRMWLDSRLRKKEIDAQVELSVQETERLKVFAGGVVEGVPDSDLTGLVEKSEKRPDGGYLFVGLDEDDLTKLGVLKKAP